MHSQSPNSARSLFDSSNICFGLLSRRAVTSTFKLSLHFFLFFLQVLTRACVRSARCQTDGICASGSIPVLPLDCSSSTSGWKHCSQHIFRRFYDCKYCITATSALVYPISPRLAAIRRSHFPALIVDLPDFDRAATSIVQSVASASEA